VSRYKAGFTLVELAIVMVVIGLIVSGVLVGQDLIQQARLRKMMNQLDQYDRALNTFLLKYNELPGDFTGAHRFFGQFSDCDNTTNVGTDFLDAGCNGNGDDYVNPLGESLLFWAHLSLAGMVPGTYSGFAASTSEDSSSVMQVDAAFAGGINVPFIGPHKSIAWAMSANSSAGRVRVGYILAVIHLGVPINFAFTTTESLTIDNKMDDGKPETGRVLAEGNCVDNGEYDLSATGINCRLYINLPIIHIVD